MRAALALFAAAIAACAPTVGGEQSSIGGRQLLAPPRAGFETVDAALVATCGTLDCHGQIGRNLRLYGGRSLRLNPDDNPAERATTPAEHQANYWSVVGLEPETLDAVVRDEGKRPERLSLIRKPLGQDHHKGGQLMEADDSLSRCLSSWLAGEIDEGACQSARPERPGSSEEQ